MGVHIELDIDPRGIDKNAWAAAYDETLALLEAWQPRLLGWGERAFDGVRVPVYLRSIRQDEGAPRKVRWCVVGDQESLQAAESQSLYRDLSRYKARGGQGDGADDDLIVTAAAPEKEYVSGPVRVLGDKTQGYPYHFAVLAAAMVVEERFPRHAMVGGDIDRGQAEEARRLARPILGRELPLPVRVDGPRLATRLRSRYRGKALAAAFKRALLDDEVMEATLRAFPGEDGAGPWLDELREYKSPDTIGVLRLFISWLNAGREMRELCRLACLAPRGPRFALEGFVEALASTWVAIPHPAREPIDVFRKPHGTSHTVATLFGSFFLDASAMGRHLRIYTEPATLRAAFTGAFGKQGPALAAKLLDKSARIEAQLRENTGNLQRFVAEAGDEASDDTETLVSIRSEEELAPNQRLAVQAMALGVHKALASLKNDAKVAALFTDAKEGKGVLTRMLARKAPTLTEDAWDRIVAEQDPGVIGWWIALMCLDTGELHASQIQRAFFENERLGQYARQLGQDEKQTREIEQRLEKMREAGADDLPVSQRQRSAPSTRAGCPGRVSSKPRLGLHDATHSCTSRNAQGSHFGLKTSVEEAHHPTSAQSSRWSDIWNVNASLLSLRPENSSRWLPW